MIRPKCPKCTFDLRPYKSGKLNFLKCQSCDGELHSIHSLGTIYSKDMPKKIWNLAIPYSERLEKKIPKKHSCPICLDKMIQFKYPKTKIPIDLTMDLCKKCKTLWFDNLEMKKLKIAEDALQTYDELKPKQQIKHVKTTTAGDITGLKYLVSAFGLPVESESDSHATPPYLNWFLLFSSIVLSIMAFQNRALFESLAFYGTRDLGSQLYNSLSVFFVHGGWMHLLGNMYFLFVFGDNVEMDLGKLKYFLLILVATSFATFAYTLGGDPKIALVGASGGISGVMGYYLCRFPFRKFYVNFFRVSYFHISAFMLVGFYFLKDIIGIILPTGSNVAHISHLAGALVGVLFYFYGKAKLRDSNKNSPIQNT